MGFRVYAGVVGTVFVERTRLPLGLDVLNGVILVAVAVPVGIGIFSAQTPPVVRVVSGLVLVALAVLVLGARAVVTVGDGVRLVLWPFMRKRLAFEDIVSARVTRVRPMADFLGYGYRVRPGRRALVMRGGDAVEFETRSGRRYVVGTRRAEELRAALVAAGVRTR